MKVQTLGGNKYFVTFIDDFSRMCWVYFLRNKSEVLPVFKKFKSMVELQYGHFVKKMITDIGVNLLQMSSMHSVRYWEWKDN